MTEKTTIDDLIFEIECMAPAGETSGIPYLRLDKADLLHKLNVIKGQSDHQPAFAVGEYYVSDDGDVYKIIDQEKTLISVKLYSKSSGRFLDITIPSHDSQDKPATAEQIVTFKLAEMQSDIGLIIKNGDADWIEIVGDIEEYLAEELREVRSDD